MRQNGSDAEFSEMGLNVMIPRRLNREGKKMGIGMDDSATRAKPEVQNQRERLDDPIQGSRAVDVIR